jgi:hypothetical protein
VGKGRYIFRGVVIISTNGVNFISTLQLFVDRKQKVMHICKVVRMLRDCFPGFCWKFHLEAHVCTLSPTHTYWCGPPVNDSYQHGALLELV